MTKLDALKDALDRLELDSNPAELLTAALNNVVYWEDRFARHIANPKRRASLDAGLERACQSAQKHLALFQNPGALPWHPRLR